MVRAALGSGGAVDQVIDAVEGTPGPLHHPATVLDRGQVVEIGSHDELVRRDGRYAQLHRAQMEIAQGCAV